MKPTIPIYESYGAYKPCVNACKIVEKLLDSIDFEYLQGLGSIVLSSQTVLPRKQRRKKFVSRGLKAPIPNIQGYYQHSWKGQPASIVLYADKILGSVPCWFAHLPMVGFMFFGKVLFHELGHHIHRTKYPEFKEKEDVADDWSGKLMKIAVRKRYRHAIPFLRPGVKVLGPPTKWLLALGNRIYAKKRLKSSSH